MRHEGVPVKALDSLPEMELIDDFYKDMYFTCGTDLPNISTYCRIYDLSKEETLEAINVMSAIHFKVK